MCCARRWNNLWAGYKDTARLADASPVSNAQIPLFPPGDHGSNCSISRNIRQSKFVPRFLSDQSQTENTDRPEPRHTAVGSIAPSGQYRAIHHGLRGKFGIPSNVGSATCRSCSAFHGSNPPSPPYNSRACKSYKIQEILTALHFTRSGAAGGGAASCPSGRLEDRRSNVALSKKMHAGRRTWIFCGG